ncbi:MAG: undecaprenyl-diphosphate phosphatase [Gemmobacter sp.]
MTLFQLALLAIVQGITEFLPISSSAHLILLHELHGPTPDAIALDVAVHLGSILAVCLYFRHDVGRALAGTVQIVTGRLSTPEAFLALCLAVATIPALVFGFVLAATGWIDALRDIRVIGATSIVFGLGLYLAHRFSPETRAAETWTLRHAVFMGLWQAVALIPGVSRSGICMTAARMLGYERHAAARISVLMSVPVTLATGAYLARKAGSATLDAGFFLDLGIAAFLAFLAAWAALALMMQFLSRVSFTPYVVYRVILGAILLIIAAA